MLPAHPVPVCTTAGSQDFKSSVSLAGQEPLPSHYPASSDSQSASSPGTPRQECAHKSSSYQSNLTLSKAVLLLAEEPNPVLLPSFEQQGLEHSRLEHHLVHQTLSKLQFSCHSRSQVLNHNTDTLCSPPCQCWVGTISHQAQLAQMS